jgi:hypothetical protein
MERVALLHIGEEIDAATLMQLGRPLSALPASAQTAPAPPEATETHALPVEAEQIRQALAQTRGNVVQAARLLGLSRDTVRYRMQRYGIPRPRLGALSTTTSTRAPRPGAGVSFPHPDAHPPKPMGLDHPPLVQEEVPDRHGAPLEPAWEQKPVAVLALELTWPDLPAVESVRYDPWTETARWEQAIMEKVRGFGAVLVERTASRYAVGQCLAYGNVVPYLPILDLLRDHCDIAPDDRQETHLAKVHASLQQAGLDLNASWPYLLPLLGVAVEADALAPLSAEARKARTFEAVQQLFLASSRQQPVVRAVEDLHWIDPPSEALLAALVDGLAGAAIMLLATFRPGYRPRWLDKSYATQLALHPLGAEESQQVVRRVLHDKALPPALEQQLLVKAEGNPFFLEELAYTLLEHREGSQLWSCPTPFRQCWRPV